MQEELLKELIKLKQEHPDREVVYILDDDLDTYDGFGHPQIEIKEVRLEKLVYGDNTKYGDEACIYTESDTERLFDCYPNPCDIDSKEFNDYLKSLPWSDVILVLYGMS